jgi:hypothetical protein
MRCVEARKGATSSASAVRITQSELAASRLRKPGQVSSMRLPLCRRAVIYLAKSLPGPTMHVLQMQNLRLCRHAGYRQQANDCHACERSSERHVHRAFFPDWARACEAFKLKKELARAPDEEAELGSRHGEVFSGKEQAASCLLTHGLIAESYSQWTVLPVVLCLVSPNPETPPLRCLSKRILSSLNSNLAYSRANSICLPIFHSMRRISA